MLFGQRLKQLRADAEMTQETLADSAGIPLSSLRGYEQSQRIPGFGAIVKLAQSLGVDCRSFADCEDISDEPPPAKPAGKKKPKK